MFGFFETREDRYAKIMGNAYSNRCAAYKAYRDELASKLKLDEHHSDFECHAVTVALTKDKRTSLYVGADYESRREALLKQGYDFIEVNNHGSAKKFVIYHLN